MDTSEPPTYEEAVSEIHRPGHKWLWESTIHGNRACKLCGFIESQRRFIGTPAKEAT